MKHIAKGQRIEVTRENEWVRVGAVVEVRYINGQRINVLVKKEDQLNDCGQDNDYFLNINNFA
jgi:hypothetical protein